jgi:hypothetical protein
MFKITTTAKDPDTELKVRILGYEHRCLKSRILAGLSNFSSPQLVAEGLNVEITPQRACNDCTCMHYEFI